MTPNNVILYSAIISKASSFSRWDPQPDNIQRKRDLGTFSSYKNVFIKFLSSELRKSVGEEGTRVYQPEGMEAINASRPSTYYKATHIYSHRDRGSMHRVCA